MVAAKVLRALVKNKNLRGLKDDADIRMAKKEAAEEEALEALSPTAREKAMSDKAKARQRKKLQKKRKLKINQILIKILQELKEWH